MSGEIEVTETPNWLKELEAKRERRLKARLGHETGAGAPCLKCGDKCPGLDLHFWRKCCKICKCSKEEHEVQDDDIYGWAQLQLLGTKPKAKPKILLLGKKEEVELDWAPKGHKETIDKYLKTLPPEQLPIKGSQAAQDRKQLLHKQIPIHDIDPTLCHELNEEELNKMNEYIAHVKKNIVGVGQIVSLSSIIKGNLHNLTPSEAAVIASRYAKGIPLSEIVKLQSHSRSVTLRHALDKDMEKLSVNDTNSNRKLPNFTPNTVGALEQSVNPITANKVHDINYPGYTRDINQALPNTQFSSGLRPGQYKNHPNQPQTPFDPTIDEKYLQNPNFDPKNTPHQFINQNVQGQPPSAFVPYNKNTIGTRPGESYVQESPILGANYTGNIPSPSGRQSGNLTGQKVGSYESVDPQHPNYAKNLAGKNNILQSQEVGGTTYENVDKIKNQALPSYAPGKYNVYTETQSPSKIPKNFKDLAFSTYEQNELGNRQFNPDGTFAPPKLAYENYPGSGPDVQNRQFNPEGVRTIPGSSNPAYENYPTGFSPGEIAGNQNLAGSGANSQFNPDGTFASANQAFKNYPPGFSTGGVAGDQNLAKNYPGSGTDVQNHQFNPEGVRTIPGSSNLVYENYPTGFSPGEIAGNQNLAGSGANSQFNPDGTFASPNQGFKNYPPGFSTGGVAGNQTLAGSEANTRFNPDGTFAPPNLSYENYPPGFNTGGATGDPNSAGAGKNYPGNGTNSLFNPDGTLAPPNLAYENYPPGFSTGGVAGDQNYSGSEGVGYGQASRTNTPKKLSELHPGRINVNEDFLQPSQVRIGAIQDINYPEIKAATQGTNDFYEDYSPDSLREILNNVKLPDCHHCKKPFEENEFAVTIDRANVLFHAECFKCAGCNQILADNVYFYNKETDNVYCGRDYAKIRGFPRCKACDELIFTKEYCLAENSTFHLKHFCCTECDTPLAGQDYTSEDEMPYCLPCFERSKASKCNSCCRIIKPDEVGCTLNNVHFHADDRCFACKMCGKPLMGKKLLLRNDKLYCSHDCFGADK